MESTLRYFGKYLDHRVLSLLVIKEGKVKHLQAVARELSTEQLTNGVNKWKISIFNVFRQFGSYKLEKT